MQFLKVFRVPSGIHLKLFHSVLLILLTTSAVLCDPERVIVNRDSRPSQKNGSVKNTMESVAKHSPLLDPMTKGRDAAETIHPTSTIADEVEIGGGKINEKDRVYTSKVTQEHDEFSVSDSLYDPSTHRAHLLHAIEGLDRYPNYLSRWAENDINSLEMELERVLEQVREQKSKVTDIRRRIGGRLEEFFEEHPHWREFCRPPESWNRIKAILDPRASRAIFRSKAFCEQLHSNPDSMTVENVVTGKTPVVLDTGYLHEWMDEELFDVYSFPLLAKTFCEELCRYVSAFMDHMESSSQYDTLTPTKDHIRSFYYKNMDSIGLGWLNDLIFHLILRPISAQLYKDTELVGGDLDWRQGFVAAYSSAPTLSKPRQRLVPHTDDAEVTLNLCFGEQFDGGNLHFWGLRGDRSTNGRFLGEYQPEIGRAIIHSGRHLHEVTEITAGNRFAYIQWARSWGSARNEICPCCWLNRRKFNDLDCCIRSKRWN